MNKREIEQRQRSTIESIFARAQLEMKENITVLYQHEVEPGDASLAVVVAEERSRSEYDG
jgi:hypothetical protein